MTSKRNQPFADDWTEPATQSQRMVEAAIPVEMECAHFKKCAGCRFDRGLDSTPVMQKAKALLSLDGVTTGPVTGWRTHAKLAVGAVSSYGGVKIGLYERGSHTIVPIPECSVHHPSVNAAAVAIEAACKKAGVTGYDEKDGDGLLRYVQLSVERSSGLVQCTLVCNAESYRDASPHAQRLVKALKAHSSSSAKGGSGGAESDPLFHSIWFHWRTGDGNAIFGRGDKRWHRAFGPEFLTEQLVLGNFGASLEVARPEAEEATDKEEVREEGGGGGAVARPPPSLPTFYFSPLIFRQGNLDAFAAIISRLATPGVLSAPEKVGGATFGGASSGGDGRRMVRSSSSSSSSGVGKSYGAAVRGEVVCELYGGMGLIGLSLLAALPDTVAELRCSDENPFNVRAFERARRSLDPALAARATFTEASAAKALHIGDAKHAGVVIVDPPRKGLDQATLDALSNPDDPRCRHAHTLAYVSCGFEALALQLPALVEGGRWRVVLSEGFALFPGSDHVETLVVFKRDVQAR